MLFLNDAYPSDPGLWTKVEIAQHYHWNMWTVKQQPFKILNEGTEVVLVDSWPGGGRLTWLVRATNVLTTSYETNEEAVRKIAKALGLTKAHVRNSSYTKVAPDQGVLLAFRYQPVRRLALPRPAELHFQVNGWRLVEDPVQLRQWGVLGSPGKQSPTLAPRKSPIGQGRLGLAERLAVEAHAMRLAEEWLRSHGYPHIEDVSRKQSWDLEARKRAKGKPLYVEVKGTTGSKVEVEVTAGEVRHAREHPADTMLIVVTDIVLSPGSSPKASGGKLHRWQPWSPPQDELKVTRYRWKPK